MDGKIDLHCHTSASDGTFTPCELIDYAIRQQLKVLAITDHDVIDGIGEALEYAKDKDISIIPGIEFSIKHTGGTFHLLGYFIDHTNRDIKEKCQWLMNKRQNRASSIIEKLKKENIHITPEELQQESPDGSIGRPHIARLLIKKNYCRNMHQAFDQYLSKGRPGYVSKEMIDFETAHKTIVKAGGFSVIAHPITLGMSINQDIADRIREFARAGVHGLEVYSSRHTDSQISFFEKLANQLGLLMTGGSDFHSKNGEENLGYYRGNQPIPYNLYTRMRALAKFDS